MLQDTAVRERFEKNSLVLVPCHIYYPLHSTARDFWIILAFHSWWEHAKKILNHHEVRTPQNINLEGRNFLNFEPATFVIASPGSRHCRQSSISIQNIPGPSQGQSSLGITPVEFGCVIVNLHNLQVWVWRIVASVTLLDNCLMTISPSLNPTVLRTQITWVMILPFWITPWQGWALLHQVHDIPWMSNRNSS
jgi:hypothetical protein